MGHVSEVPVVRSSRRSATEIPPARHRPDLGKPRVSRSSIGRNASRGATSPTRSISEKSTTFRLCLRLNRVHSTGLALPTAATPKLSVDTALAMDRALEELVWSRADAVCEYCQPEFGLRTGTNPTRVEPRKAQNTRKQKDSLASLMSVRLLSVVVQEGSPDESATSLLLFSCISCVSW